MSQYPIVLISGWAMPAGVMETLAEALDADHRRVSIVQLPGLVSELDAYRKPYDWNVLLDYLDQQLFEKPAVLVGWSLGGMLATLYASRHPENVAGVVNLAANACFVQKSDWPEAMSPALFSSFSEGLAESAGKTLRQFALLCASGSPQRKAQITLLQSLVDDAELDQTTLKELLALLGGSDLRSALADLRCPISHMFGKDDGLVPASAAELIETRFPTHRVQVLEGGHTFFMDDPGVVVREVQQLCLHIP
ncbi:alpha/beta fold hydrolase [uncultured Endozoicomonas sp.]|uniref:alpha/beta fold hydrolase n=1 Tax=uncultured Endozoicomonas sp. TaxID=432652 RepID=UPI00260E24EA|nr:alpha/beta fold hydrolase [uncultured Endozoicomonas sp.]